MSYSFESRVRFSEIGEDGCLTLPGVLDYFQDCCTFESEQTGLGMEVLKAQKRAWVLSAWQVIVKRYPKLGENINVTTIPYGFRGFIGMRNFILETMDGEKTGMGEFLLVLYQHRDRTSGKADTGGHRSL